MTDAPSAQPSPAPPTSLAMLAILAGGALERRVNDGLRPHGLSLRHLGALGHLSRDPHMSYTELARRARVTVQSMHKTVLALVDLGAVQQPPGGRGRTAALEVTERGHVLLEIGGAVIADIDAELAALLPKRSADRLTADLLAVLRSAGPAAGT